MKELIVPVLSILLAFYSVWATKRNVVLQLELSERSRAIEELLKSIYKLTEKMDWLFSYAYNYDEKAHKQFLIEVNEAYFNYQLAYHSKKYHFKKTERKLLNEIYEELTKLQRSGTKHVSEYYFGNVKISSLIEKSREDYECVKQTIDDFVGFCC